MYFLGFIFMPWLKKMTMYASVVANIFQEGAMASGGCLLGAPLPQPQF